MKGLITSVDVFTYAPVIIHLFGWKTFGKAVWRICTRKGDFTFLDCIM